MGIGFQHPQNLFPSQPFRANRIDEIPDPLALEADHHRLVPGAVPSKTEIPIFQGRLYYWDIERFELLQKPEVLGLVDVDHSSSWMAITRAASFLPSSHRSTSDTSPAAHCSHAIR